ncbi:MAG TPA: CGNR zinc finger domain-containing protein [Streptosporangiaceae bacterium]|nr:CGNR zinc finger domain-containing protein [Streptosporangiaceae bacterium]
MTATPGRAAGSDPHIGQAPGRLALLQGFVNTLDIEQATDDLGTPAALDAWLRSAGLGAERACQAGPADLTLAVELRETLRGVLRSHVARQPAAAAGPAARMAEIAAAMPARISAAADGSLHVVADEQGSRAAFAELLLIAAEAQTLGTWSRLKVCSADDCQWAFYDRSPTRSGCWCSMQLCGSRAKSRAYRERSAGRAARVLER